MRRVALISITTGLLALPLGAGAGQLVQAVPQEDRTYEVEVVSSDAASRTLTIRSDTGTSTMLVDADALRSLQGLQPGHKVTITVRNAATGQQEAITAIVNGTLRSQPGEAGSRTTVLPGTAVRTTTTVYRREVGTPVELSGFDRGTRTITLRNGAKEQAFVLASDVPFELDELAPGQRALLSWRFNRDGKPEAVIRVTPASVTATRTTTTTTVSEPQSEPQTFTRTEVVRRPPGPVEVVSVDPRLRTLTVRGEDGDQTVVVDERALTSLGQLKPGDSILLAWGDERVVVITKR